MTEFTDGSSTGSIDHYRQKVDRAANDPSERLQFLTRVNDKLIQLGDAWLKQFSRTNKHSIGSSDSSIANPTIPSHYVWIDDADIKQFMGEAGVNLPGIYLRAAYINDENTYRSFQFELAPHAELGRYWQNRSLSVDIGMTMDRSGAIAGETVRTKLIADGFATYGRQLDLDYDMDDDWFPSVLRAYKIHHVGAEFSLDRFTGVLVRQNRDNMLIRHMREISGWSRERSSFEEFRVGSDYQGGERFTIRTISREHPARYRQERIFTLTPTAPGVSVTERAYFFNDEQDESMQIVQRGQSDVTSLFLRENPWGISTAEDVDTIIMAESNALELTIGRIEERELRIAVEDLLSNMPVLDAVFEDAKQQKNIAQDVTCEGVIAEITTHIPEWATQLTGWDDQARDHICKNIYGIVQPFVRQVVTEWKGDRVTMDRVKDASRQLTRQAITLMADVASSPEHTRNDRLQEARHTFKDMYDQVIEQISG